MKKIIIVDNDTLSRECILAYITQIESDSSVYEYRRFPDANGLSGRHATVDVIIIKLLEIADKNFKALKRLKNRCCKAKIIIFTQLKNIPRIKQKLSTRSTCVIAVDLPRSRILSSIQSFLSGHSTPRTSAVVDNMSQDHESEYPTSNNSNTSISSYRSRLTHRQKQVIDYIVKGYSNKQIAYELGVSEGTIKLHVSSILRILKVSNRTQAAHKYCNAENENVNGTFTPSQSRFFVSCDLAY